MKVLKSVFRWLKLKDDEYAETIERENEVGFAKQDLDEMQKDLAKVTSNVGEVKATLAGLKRDLADKQRMVANLEEDARALLEQGKEDLASRVCEQIEMIETEAGVFSSSIEQQEKMLKTLEEKRRHLKNAVREAESSFRMMKTMDSVARASEKIATVKTGDTSSALTRFQERQKRVRSRLDKAHAINEMAEEDNGETLSKEIDAALGRGKGAGVMARLKRQVGK